MNQVQLLNELQFKGIRSSGSGGQHVNKVATKVELQFNIDHSQAFTNEEKLRLSSALRSKINKNGFLVMQCGDTRSQHRNKEILKKRLIALFEYHLKPKKVRRKTKIPNAAKIKRLQAKRRVADKKANRKKPKID